MRPTAFYKSILTAVDKPLHLVMQFLIPTQIQIFFSSADVPSYIHFGSATRRRRIRRGKSGIFEKTKWHSLIPRPKFEEIASSVDVLPLINRIGACYKLHASEPLDNQLLWRTGVQDYETSGCQHCLSPIFGFICNDDLHRNTPSVSLIEGNA